MPRLAPSVFAALVAALVTVGSCATPGPGLVATRSVENGEVVLHVLERRSSATLEVRGLPDAESVRTLVEPESGITLEFDVAREAQSRARLEDLRLAAAAVADALGPFEGEVKVSLARDVTLRYADGEPIDAFGVHYTSERGSEGLFVEYAAGARAYAHELAHLRLNELDPALDPWIDEGIASVLEAFASDGVHEPYARVFVVADDEIVDAVWGASSGRDDHIVWVATAWGAVYTHHRARGWSLREVVERAKDVAQLDRLEARAVASAVRRDGPSRPAATAER